MTRPSDRHDNRLLEQDDAIRGYLDALLRDLPDAEIDTEPAPGAAPPEPAPSVVPVAPPREAPPPANAPVPDTASADAAPVNAPGIPEWAQPEFQALLFSVGELKLAVPLVKLHSVIPWSEHIATMPRQPDWAHGMMRYRDKNVVVIDTARMVLPPQHARADAEAGEPAHILIVGDGRWGLACRSIGEVVRLKPDEVRWRSQRGQRPWLAGTVLGRLCALMDTGAFADMLNTGAQGAAVRTQMKE
ncbi:chemotaxis protein CheW [Arhodomonas sp. AD133]|uniref:chemotaxis protein CheW n=1 Tax=Arhodomonas sp. AD133 TaxID=3415009 RepID=UPI003EBABE76